jgi:hypothetical protein
VELVGVWGLLGLVLYVLARGGRSGS